MIWDVIVVGAGPAGCAVSVLLARAGLRVLLLDKSAAPPPKVCGEYLSPGCLHILELLGALGPVREAGARSLCGMLIHTVAGRTLRATYPQEGGASGRAHHGLAIPRAVLDPILLDLALKSGAQFEPHFQVSDLAWEGDRVVGIRGRLRGEAITLRARLIIGADGRNSVVARRIGRMERHGWLDKIALVGYFSGIPRADDLGEIFLGRDRYGILNPIGPDQTNVGLVINRCDFAPTGDPGQLLLTASRTIPSLGERLATGRLAGPVRCLGPLAHRATRLTALGALLVGDAAGFLDPFTGEGLYAGLRSAELAARFALPALTTQAPSSPDLAGYAAAWSQEFRPKWRLCLGLQHAIRRPFLAEWLVARLTTRPDLTAELMAAVGDLVPTRSLGLANFFLRLLSF